MRDAGGGVVAVGVGEAAVASGTLVAAVWTGAYGRRDPMVILSYFAAAGAGPTRADGQTTAGQTAVRAKHRVLSLVVVQRTFGWLWAPVMGAGGFVVSGGLVWLAVVPEQPRCWLARSQRPCWTAVDCEEASMVVVVEVSLECWSFSR